MTVLYDVMLGVAEKISIMQHGVSTGGSVSTLIDTTRTTQDDFFNDGTLFVATGTKNAKTFHHISDYVSSTGVFTIPTLANAIVAAQVYAASIINSDDLVSKINMALQEMGMTLVEDKTLAVVASQLEYTLPTGVSSVRKVEDLDETNTPVVPSTKYRWDEVGGLLRFVNGFAASGGHIRFTYRGTHPVISLAADVVSPYIDLQWLITKASLLMAMNFMRSSGDTGKWKPTIDMLMQDEMRQRHPAPDMPIIKLARW